YWARVIYRDKSGKRHVAQRQVETRAGAIEALDQLSRGIKQESVQSVGKGTIGKDKNWYGRFDYTDSNKNRRTVRVRASTKTEAEDKLSERIATLKYHGSRPLETARKTFDDLADLYESNYLEPDDEEGDPNFGFRSVRSRKSYLKTLR